MNRTEYENSHREDWMSDDQFECYKFIADIMCGFNHMFGKVSPDGDGIEFISSLETSFATYDYDQMTVAVVLAHDRCIRFSIEPYGRKSSRMVAHKRHSREGDISEKIPTLESHIEKIRSRYNKNTSK